MYDILDVRLEIDETTPAKFEWQLVWIFGVSGIFAALAIIGACDVFAYVAQQF